MHGNLLLLENEPILVIGQATVQNQVIPVVLLFTFTFAEGSEVNGRVAHILSFAYRERRAMAPEALVIGAGVRVERRVVVKNLLFGKAGSHILTGLITRHSGVPYMLKLGRTDVFLTRMKGAALDLGLFIEAA